MRKQSPPPTGSRVKKNQSPPPWLKEVTPDDEVMAAFYRGVRQGSQLRELSPLAPPQTIPDELPRVQPSGTEQYGTVRNSTEQYGTVRNTTTVIQESLLESAYTSDFTIDTPDTHPTQTLSSPTSSSQNQYGTVRNSTEQYGTLQSLTPGDDSKANQPPVQKPPLSLSPISAQRDFNKRPNSLERDAVPLGLFPGTTKVLYDILFQRSRGAVDPTRFVQATSVALVKWAKLSEKTLWRHLTYLERIGLVIRRMDLQFEPTFDKRGGNVYEVSIPEEIDLPNALEIAKSFKLNKAGTASFPQGNSTEQYGTVRNNVPGTVRNNVPYQNDGNRLESTYSEPLRHVIRHSTEEESAAARLTAYLCQTLEENLERPLSLEEKLGVFATLTEELLDIVHNALQANAQFGKRPIDNPVAWFTAMIGQRLAGRNRKRTPEESLRAAIWITLREIERQRGGRITSDERDEVEYELVQRLTSRFSSKVDNPARFIKEQVTSWWMMTKGRK